MPPASPLVDRAAIPFSHPCHSPHASCHSPHALKGQKLLAQGIRPGYSCPHAWRPVGAKALYGDRTSGFASQSILELAMGFLLIMLKCSLFGDKILLALFGLTDFGLYICTKISELWTKVYIQNYTNA